MESSTLKKQHVKAIQEATKILRKQTGRDDVSFQGFDLYTLRHTCLMRWAPHMDPWTLAYLAGHRDMNITKRYVHSQEQTIRAAMDRARGVEGGHTFGHTAQNLNPGKVLRDRNPLMLRNFLARPERLELPTYWFEASRSIHLSYGRAVPSILTAGYGSATTGFDNSPNP